MLTSLRHHLVKRLTRLRKEKSAREEEGRALLCGTKLIADAGVPLLRLLLPADVPPPCETQEIIRVTPEILTKIGGRTDAIAEVELPPPAPLQTFERLLVLDGIGDPGNLGTLLRTALAFGWSELLLLPGCADPFNDKALRASQAAIFHLRYRWGSIDDLPPKAALLVAHTQGKASAEISGPLALALGSEGQGLSQETLDRGQPVTIPIAVESLNVAVAGGILMCRFRP